MGAVNGPNSLEMLADYEAELGAVHRTHLGLEGLALGHSAMFDGTYPAPEQGVGRHFGRS